MAVTMSKRDYTPCPAGFHKAVCADVSYRWQVEGKFGVKDQVWLAFLIDPAVGTVEMKGEQRPFKVNAIFNVYADKDGNGKPVLDDKSEPNLRLTEKQSLYEFLEGWGGMDFTTAIKEGQISLENLVGQQCQINVAQKENADGRIFANIKSIAPPQEGQDLKADGYTREKDREAADKELPF